VHRGVPVTTAGRTLLDLAATGPPGRLDLAVNEAQALRLITRAELEQLASSGRRGAGAPRGDPGRSRLHPPGGRAPPSRTHPQSAAAAPRFNARTHGDEVDALWPDSRLIVEVDGFATHGSRGAFERDRRADQRRAAAGYRTVRVTWRQLTTQPEAVVASLAAALARS
jgi:hypothetical protein